VKGKEQKDQSENSSSNFEYFILGCIVLNTIFLCMEYYDAPKTYKSFLNVGNNVFVGIFTLEAILKILAHGFSYYWHIDWNKFDFIIVLLSLLSSYEGLFSFNVTALRIIRVARLLRMIKTSKGLRHLLKTLYMSLGNIVNVGLLMFLIFFTFAVAGMGLFGSVPHGKFINKNTNFESFYLGVMTLFRASTGESWNGIMHDTSAGGKTILSVIFWVSFVLIAFFIFMNVFIAVIYENFNDIMSSEDPKDVLNLKRKDIKNFLNTWAQIVPNGAHMMPTIKFAEFLRKLPPPLGFKDLNMDDAKLNRIIQCFNIRDHQGEVYFPEVMWVIFHSVAGNNDTKVHNCEPVINLMKQLKRKYKRFKNKKLSPDLLVCNKYFKTEITVSKYLCAKKIVDRWREIKKKRAEEEEKKKDREPKKVA